MFTKEHNNCDHLKKIYLKIFYRAQSIVIHNTKKNANANLSLNTCN